MKRLETYRGRDGMRSGEVSANKGVKERAGKGCKESDRKERGETTTRNCMNGKSEEKDGDFFLLLRGQSELSHSWWGHEGLRGGLVLADSMTERLSCCTTQNHNRASI